jgi:RimJ/RimL family protein N-acetyltransferase
MARVGWCTTGAVDEFLAEAGEFLRAEPARNTVILSVTENLLLRAATRPEPHPLDAGGTTPPRADEPLLGWWRPGPGGNAALVSGAFLHTPGFPLFLTSTTGEAVTGLAGVLATVGRRISGLNAEPQAAEAFAAAWRQRTGDAATVHRLMRLYRLGTLVRPDPGPAGQPRVAGEGDRDLLIEWSAAFVREVGDEAHELAGAVDERLGYGGLTVWDADGTTVSMAGITRIVSGMARVGSVYTPPALRGRGYAGAVTAAVSRAALDVGATEVVLYTDLANPTSNALYERLGYRLVEDRTELSFRPGLGSPPPAAS